MATTRALADHLAGLRGAVDRMSAYAVDAGLAAPVPTCAPWSVRDLLAHQGMVHRWATAHLVGDEEMARTPEPIEVEGRNEPNPVTWLKAGAEDLVAAVEAAPADLKTFVFLKSAPPAPEFWARRQCHETTIHAVDAQAATLGRAPSVAESGIDVATAVDGLDELLTGFVPRRHERVRAETPFTLAVRPDDSDDAWLLEVSDVPVRATRHTSSDVPDADREVSGSAVALYLGLWNRGGEVSDPSGLLPTWREQLRIGW